MVNPWQFYEAFGKVALSYNAFVQVPLFSQHLFESAAKFAFSRINSTGAESLNQKNTEYISHLLHSNPNTFNKIYFPSATFQPENFQ